MNEDFEKRIKSLEDRVAVLEKNSKVSISPSDVGKRSKPSINEFLSKKNPKTALETILVLAGYHEQFTGQDSFNANDILTLIRKAKQKKPKNVNDVINKNILKGYFEEDDIGEDGKKRWYVTDSGTALINNGFNQDGKDS